ncbi:MAG: isoquinoline 1-oxidoreductase, partial [Betaproteobacteria bacterium HGW-Betaproteobacteria-21]
MTAFSLNGRPVSAELPEDTPLLWVLRDGLDMTGTKFGCGMALCGACTVHVDGVPVRSCSTPLSAVSGKQVTTIEAIGDARIGKAV